MSVWYIFVAFLGPMVALMVGMMVAQHRGYFRSPGAKQDAPDFGRCHPMLITVAFPFALGFVVGGISGRPRFILGAVIGGFGGTIFFLLLSFALALIVTLGQSMRHLLRRESAAKVADSNDVAARAPFLRRFMSNLEGAFQIVIQGWSP